MINLPQFQPLFFCQNLLVQSGVLDRDRGLTRQQRENLDVTLREGVELEPLYIGKIAQKHIAIIEELRYRRILREPPLTPRVLEDSAARERLDAVRRGITLTEMICPEPD